jgi:ABC-type amino acid transport substrate-binding protein
VAFVPTRRDRLFQDLRDGKGDIAAGNLTITPQRDAVIDFVKPWAGGVKEVLVTGPSAPNVAAVSDLGGRELTVRKSSSYYEHLLELGRARRLEAVARGREEKRLRSECLVRKRRERCRRDVRTRGRAVRRPHLQILSGLFRAAVETGQAGQARAIAQKQTRRFRGASIPEVQPKISLPEPMREHRAAGMATDADRRANCAS